MADSVLLRRRRRQCPVCYCVGPPGPWVALAVALERGALRDPSPFAQRRCTASRRPSHLPFPNPSPPFPTASRPILSRSLNVDQPWRGVTERAPAQRAAPANASLAVPRPARYCPARARCGPDPSPTRFSGWPSRGPSWAEPSRAQGAPRSVGWGRGGSGAQWSRVWCKLAEWGTG